MRNSTNLDKVREFHKVFGSPLDAKHKVGSDLENLRFKLIDEEFFEVTEATYPEEILKELADLVYVCYGYAATFGWDLDTAFNRVHESNMSKLGEDGKPVYREDRKVLKGPNYKPPYLGDLV